MRWAGTVVAVLGISAFVTVARAEPFGARGARADLPVGIAAFPVEVSSVAQVRAVSAPPPAAGPPAATAIVSAPAPSPAPAPAPSPEQAAVALPAPSSGDAASDCPRAVELGAAALVAMIRDGKGLFAVLGVFGDSSDAKIIDDAAEKEVRRLRLMHRLAAMREEESEREFSEKLSGYLRKKAFLDGLEAHRQLAPSPFGSPSR